MEEAPLLRTHLIDHITSIKQELPHSLDRKLFKEHLQSLDNDIVRIKGFVTFDDSNKQYLIQCVNKTFNMIELEDTQKREKFLIYIGKNLNQQSIHFR